MVTTNVAAVAGSEWATVLVQGNSAAKTHARRILGKRKLGRFLRVLNNPACASSLKIRASEVEAILAIPQADRQAICDSREIAQEVCLRFEKLAIRIARRYAVGVGRDSDADISQLESEAKVGLLKAIRAYSDPQVKFITYAYKAISNEVSRYLQRGMGNTLTGVNQSLLVQYGKKLTELALASQPCSFEDVCLVLGFTAGQISRLKDSMRAVMSHESDMEDALAKILVDPRKDTRVDRDLIARLEAVALTAMEKLSFISQSDAVRSLFPDSFRSLKAVAHHFEVTPQAVSEALKRARRKLAKALGDDFRP